MKKLCKSQSIIAFILASPIPSSQGHVAPEMLELSVSLLKTWLLSDFEIAHYSSNKMNFSVYRVSLQN